MNIRRVLLLVLFSVFAVSALHAQRSFRMGFSTFAHDNNQQAWRELESFLQKNADIVLFHVESVPWKEALHDVPFPKALMDDWNKRKQLKLAPGTKIYVAVSPLNFNRSDIAASRGDAEYEPLPDELKGVALDDPKVKQAYLNFCVRTIEYFHPDYMAIGIEVNELYWNSPKEKWPAYVRLHQFVYTELKKKFPRLPLFATFTVDSALGVGRRDQSERMVKAYQELMPWNDVVAISFYPFLRFISNDVPGALRWVSQQFGRYGKPFAVAETGEQGVPTVFKLGEHSIRYEGGPNLQEDFYRALFSFANDQHCVFVIPFFYRDYGALIERTKPPEGSPLFVWRHNGLLDDEGRERPAFKLWQKYFEQKLMTASAPK